MQNLSTAKSALFISGIHMDVQGRLDAPALIGASNPGTFSSMPGGASLNSASVARQLGLESYMVGFVGDDKSGDLLAKTVRKRKLHNALHICEGKNTGTYTSIIEPDGNLHIAIADLALNEEMEAGWLHQNRREILENTNLWFLNSNLKTHTITELTSADFPIRPPIIAAASISPSKSRHLAGSLQNIDMLFTNIAEASAMLHHRAGDPYDGPLFTAEHCIKNLQALGITQGSLSQGADILWVWQENEVKMFRPTKMEKIQDVTGAGDALAGAYMAGIASGETMFRTTPFAIAAAQMIISTTGPYNDQLCLAALKEKAVEVEHISI